MDKHTFDDKARPEHDRETEFHDPGNDARVGDSSMDFLAAMASSSLQG